MGQSLPPSGEDYTSGRSLLDWMEQNHARVGDVFRATVYGGETYVVSDPQWAEHVLRRNWQNYRKGLAIKRVAMLLGNGLMVSEGALWKRQRRMIQPSFHQKVLEQMFETIVAANARLVSTWQQAARTGEPVNVTRDTSVMTLEIVLRTIFSNDYAPLAPHFGLLSEGTARDMGFARAFRALDRVIIEAMTARRQREPLPDFLGLLMNCRDKDTGRGMSEAQLVNEIMTLIVAGHETTASTLNWTWYLLSQHPEVEQKLTAAIAAAPDPSNPSSCPYVVQVIEEALRMYPAGWLMTRRAINDDRLGDYFVPAGTEIYISPYIIQRHPDHWVEPQRFYPERFATERPDQHPLAMMPFSAGPRNCIGEHLARLEMHTHLLMVAGQLRLRYIDHTPLVYDLGVNLRNKFDFIMKPELYATHAVDA